MIEYMKNFFISFSVLVLISVVYSCRNKTDYNKLPPLNLQQLTDDIVEIRLFERPMYYEASDLTASPTNDDTSQLIIKEKIIIDEIVTCMRESKEIPIENNEDSFHMIINSTSGCVAFIDSEGEVKLLITPCILNTIAVWACYKEGEEIRIKRKNYGYEICTNLLINNNFENVLFEELDKLDGYFHRLITPFHNPKSPHDQPSVEEPRLPFSGSAPKT